MEMQANDILRIRFIVWVFDVDRLCSHTRYATEILSDGTIVCSVFEKGVRKPVEKHTYHNASPDDYRKLCAEINEWIEKADTLNTYVNDTCAQVMIYRPFSRKEIMDGGYGTQEKDMVSILNQYCIRFRR
ncbi:MAG: hypothetical protein ACI32N_10035 [Bulleidia sp.]